MSFFLITFHHRCATLAILSLHAHSALSACRSRVGRIYERPVSAGHRLTSRHDECVRQLTRGRPLRISRGSYDATSNNTTAAAQQWFTGAACSRRARRRREEECVAAASMPRLDARVRPVTRRPRAALGFPPPPPLARRAVPSRCCGRAINRRMCDARAAIRLQRERRTLSYGLTFATKSRPKGCLHLYISSSVAWFQRSG